MENSEYLYLRNYADDYTINTTKVLGSDYYETMVFGQGYTDLYAKRYDTREEATQGHVDICDLIVCGFLPWET